MVTSAAEKEIWNETQGKLRKTFSTLTVNDLDFPEDRKAEMLEKIQLKLGKTKEEFTAILAAL